MADKKISQLSGASTPLAGTEVVPIVQAGSTVKVAVSDLTASRDVSTKSVTQGGFKTPYTFFTCGIPFVLPSSGTMGNNGALSGITAIASGQTYPHAYVYLPANAISAGSAAGWYYAQFSSTTAATVYNNTYTSGIPTVPSSPTAFVTTGPGAYTQGVGAEIPAITLTLPANSIGVNGSIDTTFSASTTNNVNSKIFRVALDSTANQFYVLTSNSSVFHQAFSSLKAAGVTNRQTATCALTAPQGGLGTSTSGTGAGTALSVDMTAQRNFIFYVRNLVATDTSVLLNPQVIITP